MKDRTKVGGNNPPSELDAQQSTVDKVLDDAVATLTGVIVETEEQDATVATLLKELKMAKTGVTKAHKSDKQPWLDGGKRVDAQKNKLIEDLNRAINTAQDARTPYLQKLETERQEDRRKAQEEAEKAQAELEAKHQEKRTADIEDANKLAELEEKAKVAAKVAAKAARPVATGMRTVWNTEIKDLEAAINHYFTDFRLSEAVLNMAKSDVHSGKREIPGFEIQSEGRAK